MIHSNNLINQPYLVQRRQKKRKSLSTKFGLEYHGIQGIIPRVLITWVVRDPDVIQDQLAQVPIFLQILEASWAGVFNYRWFHAYQRL